MRKITREYLLLVLLLSTFFIAIRSYYIDKVSAKSTSQTSTTIYFSQYGNDDNDGLSEDKPKKDFTQYSGVSNVILKFKCGENFVFDSEIDSFIVGTNVEITSYGEGERPIICGYQTLDGTWTKESNNIYYISLKDYDQSQQTDNCRINIGSLRISSANSDDKVSFGRVYKKKLLSSEGDFYIDYKKERLYIYSKNNPKANKYELARTGSCITLQKENQGVSIQGIAITGFSRHGISGEYNHVQISKCYIYNIGGQQIYPNDIKNEGWERMGNGIEVWGNGSKNVVIENNYVENCFDAGITVQASNNCTGGARNVEFKENVVKNCYYLIEVFNSNSQNVFSNISFHDNALLYCNSIGYRMKYLAYSQLCIWSQAYSKDSINVYDNLFAYTNKYTCYAYSPAKNIYCKLYNNTFISEGAQGNEYGNEMIGKNNSVYDVQNEFMRGVQAQIYVFRKLSEIGMLEE